MERDRGDAVECRPGSVPSARLRDAGLEVERWEELRGEWREHLEEVGDRKTSRQLLRVARMLRDPERYKAAIGEREYEVELGDCLYGIYQLLGKLERDGLGPAAAISRLTGAVVDVLINQSVDQLNG